MTKYRGNLNLATTKNEELIKHKANVTARKSTMTFRGKVSGLPMELRITTTPEKVQGIKQTLGLHGANDLITITAGVLEGPLDNFTQEEEVENDD